MTTTLYLIRHGETDWNVNGRWQGHTDVPLNNKGKQQARLLAQYLHDQQMHFDAIYSSDLTRAFQTAWEIGAALRIAVQLWPPLREIDLGYWSGLTREDIRQQYPDDYQRLQAGEDIPRGGAETRAALYQRVAQTVEAMIQHHPNDTLALMMHGGSIRALIDYAVAEHHATLTERQHIANTGITVLQCESNNWHIRAYNQTPHLHPSPEVDLVSSPPDDAERPMEWTP